MTDNTAVSISLVAVLFDKLLSAGKSYLCDVFFNLIGCHTKTVIAYSKCFSVLVKYNVNTGLSSVVLGFTDRTEALILFNSIAAVGDHFSEENILIGIKPLFDYRKKIFRINSDLSFFFQFNYLV